MHRSLAYLRGFSGALAGVLLVLSSSGCFLYFGDDGDDCLYGGPYANDAPSAEAPAIGVRNPTTGLCEYIGGGGGCDSACGVCDETPPSVPGSMASWGYCESYCTNLDETTCLATSGCRGAYVEGGGYFDCWAVDLTGPVQGGVCEDTDAWTCSQHDDCIAIHSNSCSTDPATGSFVCTAGEYVGCKSEPVGCFTDNECSPGQVCNATEVCMSPPGCGGAAPGDPAGPGVPASCDAACYGFCERAPHPGFCEGEVLCDAPPPECPADSQPGIIDGCWSGACLPSAQCQPEPVACAQIADEQLCIARADCDALYAGSDCTCDAAGDCQCSTWTFTGCTLLSM